MNTTSMDKKSPASAYEAAWLLIRLRFMVARRLGKCLDALVK
jgi:hypothetical protein